MFCPNCGKNLENEVKFCPACGMQINSSDTWEQKGMSKQKHQSISRKKKIFGEILGALGIIFLIMAFTGKFDKAAHDITNGAYGDPDKQSTLYNREGNTEDNKSTNIRNTELSHYLNYTEDELIKELNVSKNMSGYYPNDDLMNFGCMDGKVYMLRINDNHPEDKNYTLFGVSLADNVNELPKEFLEEFTYSDTFKANDNEQDLYVNKNSGYEMVLEYGSDKKVILASYITIAETASENSTEETESEDDVLIQEFINLLNSYSNPPELIGDKLDEYYKQEYKLWETGQGYTYIIRNDEGHLIIVGDASAYIGQWWDTYSQRCNMEIECYDGTTYYIDINWGSSAWDNTHWSFVGTYDINKNGILYSGSRIEEYYSDNGDIQETYTYTNGEGLLYIGDDGMLYWDDYLENAGADCCFERN